MKGSWKSEKLQRDNKHTKDKKNILADILRFQYLDTPVFVKGANNFGVQKV